MSLMTRGLALGTLLSLASSAPAQGRDTTPAHRIQVGGGTIEVRYAGASPIPEESLLRWIDSAARGVVAYFGRYPVPRVRLYVRAGGRSIGPGTTYGGRVPSIRMAISRTVAEEELRDDWMLAHEMVHLAFPDLTSDDSWAEEGVATYVEPLARLRIGNLTEDQVWRGFMRGLPQGLPRRGDTGLHATEEWGRTYWGGALFWLLADVEIREKTRNRRGLPDALVAILESGGDIRADRDLKETLEIGDRAVGTSVLSDLYLRLAATPGNVDLQDLWRRLGVKQVQGRIVYDESAPLAYVRRAITGARPQAS